MLNIRFMVDLVSRFSSSGRGSNKLRGSLPGPCRWGVRGKPRACARVAHSQPRAVTSASVRSGSGGSGDHLVDLGARVITSGGR